MYRIKCSNGKYVSKTGEGRWVETTKNGKTWGSINLAKKNLGFCLKFTSNALHNKYKVLQYEIEEVNKQSEPLSIYEVANKFYEETTDGSTFQDFAYWLEENNYQITKK